MPIVIRYCSKTYEYPAASAAEAAIVERLPRYPDEVWEEDAVGGHLAEFFIAMDGRSCRLHPIPPRAVTQPRYEGLPR